MPTINGNTLDNTRKLRGGTAPAFVGWRLSVLPLDTVVSSAGSVDSDDDDARIRTYNPATIDHGWEIRVTETEPLALAGLTWASANEAIATVNSQGHVSRVSDGTVVIYGTTSKAVRKGKSLTVSRENGVTTVEILNFLAGTLGKNCADAIDTRIAGKTPSVAKPMFSTANHATATYVRNTDCWAADLDLTCIGAAANYFGSFDGRFAGALVSPRHLVGHVHSLGANGMNGLTVRFVTADNVTVTRTLSSSQQIGSTDIRVYVLDSDVPGTIGFAKVLPATWADYLPGLAYGLPCLAVDQVKNALVAEWKSGAPADVNCDFPHNATRLSFNEKIIPGDSGSPLFAIIDDELVLLTTWKYGYAGSGPAIHANIAAINSAMTSLGGGYQLTQADLSSFTEF
jgi:hypothetical protein